MSSSSRSIEPDPLLAGLARPHAGRHPAATEAGRLVVVSDRLPLALTREGGGGWRTAAEGGGLVPLLAPLLRDRRSLWIGWPGVAGEAALALRQVLPGAIHRGGCSLRPVMLGQEEKQGCYGGFSGEVIWPLFHGLEGECRFDPAHWRAYLRVNRRFARVIAGTLAAPRRTAQALVPRHAARGDLLWIHDHLLMSVAAELRKLEVRTRAAFFLHIPFPGPDTFAKLPWRERLLAGLLAHDRLGFQTARDLANFLACVRAMAPGIRVLREEAGSDGESGAATARLTRLVGEIRGRRCRLAAGAFPIGVDCAEISRRAARPEVGSRLAALRRELGGRRLVLGVDTLERSQGVVEKLAAFAELLARRPDLHDRVCLLQVVLPSREGLDRRQALRAEIERLVGAINGRFARPGWVPVLYRHQPLMPAAQGNLPPAAGGERAPGVPATMPESEMLALYALADVALLTPLRDGMNLIAKEFCAARLDGQGVLVLSEFAGAAEQLAAGALLVNPFDAAGTARALRRALRLPPEEQAARMARLRREVARRDLYWWADAFQRAAAEDLELAPHEARRGL